jgi:hypothetical protein
MSHVPNGITGVQGEVRLEVPEQTEGLVALVFPPGFAARMVPLASTTERAVLPLTREGGTLRVEWVRNPAAGASDLETPYLLHDGALVSLTSFRRWVLERGLWDLDAGQIVLPLLAPGRYTVCPPGSPEQRPRAAGGAPDAQTGCKTGLVPAGGELTLTVP